MDSDNNDVSDKGTFPDKTDDRKKKPNDDKDSQKRDAKDSSAKKTTTTKKKNNTRSKKKNELGDESLESDSQKSEKEDNSPSGDERHAENDESKTRSPDTKKAVTQKGDDSSPSEVEKAALKLLKSNEEDGTDVKNTQDSVTKTSSTQKQSPLPTSSSTSKNGNKGNGSSDRKDAKEDFEPKEDGEEMLKKLEVFIEKNRDKMSSRELAKLIRSKGYVQGGGRSKDSKEAPGSVSKTEEKSLQVLNLEHSLGRKLRIAKEESEFREARLKGANVRKDRVIRDLTNALSRKLIYEHSVGGGVSQNRKKNRGSGKSESGRRYGEKEHQLDKHLDRDSDGRREMELDSFTARDRYGGGARRGGTTSTVNTRHGSSKKRKRGDVSDDDDSGSNDGESLEEDEEEDESSSVSISRYGTPYSNNNNNTSRESKRQTVSRDFMHTDAKRRTESLIEQALAIKAVKH